MNLLFFIYFASVSSISVPFKYPHDNKSFLILNILDCINTQNVSYNTCIEQFSLLKCQVSDLSDQFILPNLIVNNKFLIVFFATNIFLVAALAFKYEFLQSKTRTNT